MDLYRILSRLSKHTVSKKMAAGKAAISVYSYADEEYTEQNVFDKLRDTVRSEHIDNTYIPMMFDTLELSDNLEIDSAALEKLYEGDKNNIQKNITFYLMQDIKKGKIDKFFNEDNKKIKLFNKLMDYKVQYFVDRIDENVINNLLKEANTGRNYTGEFSNQFDEAMTLLQYRESLRTQISELVRELSSSLDDKQLAEFENAKALLREYTEQLKLTINKINLIQRLNSDDLEEQLHKDKKLRMVSDIYKSSREELRVTKDKLQNTLKNIEEAFESIDLDVKHNSHLYSGLTEGSTLKQSIDKLKTLSDSLTSNNVTAKLDDDINNISVLSESYDFESLEELDQYLLQHFHYIQIVSKKIVDITHRVDDNDIEAIGFGNKNFEDLSLEDSINEEQKAELKDLIEKNFILKNNAIVLEKAYEQGNFDINLTTDEGDVELNKEDILNDRYDKLLYDAQNTTEAKKIIEEKQQIEKFLKERGVDVTAIYENLDKNEDFKVFNNNPEDILPTVDGSTGILPLVIDEYRGETLDITIEDAITLYDEYSEVLEEILSQDKEVNKKFKKESIESLKSSISEIQESIDQLNIGLGIEYVYPTAEERKLRDVIEQIHKDKEAALLEEKYKPVYKDGDRQQRRSTGWEDEPTYTGNFLYNYDPNFSFNQNLEGVGIFDLEDTDKMNKRVLERLNNAVKKAKDKAAKSSEYHESFGYLDNINSDKDSEQFVNDLRKLNTLADHYESNMTKILAVLEGESTEEKLETITLTDKSNLPYYMQGLNAPTSLRVSKDPLIGKSTPIVEFYSVKPRHGTQSTQYDTEQIAQSSKELDIEYIVSKSSYTKNDLSEKSPDYLNNLSLMVDAGYDKDSINNITHENQKQISKLVREDYTKEEIDSFLSSKVNINFVLNLSNIGYDKEQVKEILEDETLKNRELDPLIGYPSKLPAKVKDTFYKTGGTPLAVRSMEEEQNVDRIRDRYQKAAQELNKPSIKQKGATGSQRFSDHTEDGSIDFDPFSLTEENIKLHGITDRNTLIDEYYNNQKALSRARNKSDILQKMMNDAEEKSQQVLKSRKKVLEDLQDKRKSFEKIVQHHDTSDIHKDYHLDKNLKGLSNKQVAEYIRITNTIKTYEEIRDEELNLAKDKLKNKPLVLARIKAKINTTLNNLNRQKRELDSINQTELYKMGLVNDPVLKSKPLDNEVRIKTFDEGEYQTSIEALKVPEKSPFTKVFTSSVDKDTRVIASKYGPLTRTNKSIPDEGEYSLDNNQMVFNEKQKGETVRIYNDLPGVQPNLTIDIKDFNSDFDNKNQPLDQTSPVTQEVEDQETDEPKKPQQKVYYERFMTVDDFLKNN